MKDLIRVFNFGKINYYSNRRENLVTVEVSLKYNKEGLPIFSACGNIWNRRKTDCLSCGQNLGEIKKYLKNDTFDKIYDLWIKYHLNDMNAGTVEQMEALKQFKGDYAAQCEYLKSINLYEIDGYKYGHGWVYFQIPENDLKEIIKLLS